MTNDSNYKCISDVVTEAMLEKGFSNFYFPHDSEGECVFHSQNKEWKKSLFAAEFKKLVDAISLLRQSHEFTNYYDFREFVVVTETKEDKKFLSNLHLDTTVCFDGSTFCNHLSIDNSKFCNLSLDKCSFKGYLSLTGCEIDYLYIRDSVINNGLRMHETSVIGDAFLTDNKIVTFLQIEKCSFPIETDFSRTAVVENGEDYEIMFDRTQFNGTVKFHKTKFEIDTTFVDVSFKGDAEFQDTIFPENYSTGFQDVIIEGTLIFKSTNEKKKMFSNDVFFSVPDVNEVKGNCILDNVDLSFVKTKGRDILFALEKLEHARIANNCVKYATRSKVHKHLGPDFLQEFTIDLANVIKKLFNVLAPGHNVGVEIIEKIPNEYVSYFFFSDVKMDQLYFDSLIESAKDNLFETVGLYVSNKALVLPADDIKKRHIILDMASLIWKIRDYVNSGYCEEKILHDLLPDYTGFTLINAQGLIGNAEKVITAEQMKSILIAINELKTQIDELKEELCYSETVSNNEFQNQIEVNSLLLEGMQRLYNEVEEHHSLTDKVRQIASDIANGITIGTITPDLFRYIKDSLSILIN